MTIDLYTWSTPNGRKISIALEEMGLAYAVHPINIGKDEQFAPDFLKISPNNKIPAIVDRETARACSSRAPSSCISATRPASSIRARPKTRIRIHEWLMWQMSAIGPFLGRAHYFLNFNPGKAPFAEEWFAAEAKRLYGVLDRLLAAPGLHVRRLFDRRYRDLPVDRALRVAAHRSRRTIPMCSAGIARSPRGRRCMKGYKVPDAAGRNPDAETSALAGITSSGDGLAAMKASSASQRSANRSSCG